MNEKRFYSLEEVAEILSVDYQLIYKLVSTGKLPAVRVGRIFRVRQEDFDAFLAANTTTAPDAASHRCGACGRGFASRRSLKTKCSAPDCDEKICVDCRARLGADTCAAHAIKPNKP